MGRLVRPVFLLINAMTIKQHILRWLGFPALIEAHTEEFSVRLNSQRQGFQKQFKLELEQALAEQRTALKAELKHEFDTRIGCVLEASITASEKIARMVASQGDSNLKDYIDGCLTVFENVTTEQLAN